MPTAFQKANNRNRAEVRRLEKLIANLKRIQRVTNNWDAENWSEFNDDNINRLQNLYATRKANPANYNIKKLTNTKDSIGTRRTARHWMYGYAPKVGANWVAKRGRWVPPNLPINEIEEFYRVGKPGRLINARGGPLVLNKSVKGDLWRSVLTKEGTLKPVSGKIPVPFKPKNPVHGFLPTLKELAWKAKSSNENFETVKTMNNKQLKLLSKVGPINWTLLKPKKRAAPLAANNLTKYRRQAAARTIGKTVKKYQKKKPGQGPAPRSPATLARQANLRIMGGVRRAAATNNTRITWSRNSNGKINRFKTLENINLTLTNAQRNALAKMSENQAMNTIRKLARQR